jgi:hypothetical protein
MRVMDSRGGSISGTTGHTRTLLCVYDRFGKLCDPSRAGNIASAKQYPSFVSFIESLVLADSLWSRP